MKIKYLGHSTFLITSDSGTRIITDPYEPGSYGGAIGYPAISEAADVVTVSHEHNDHWDPSGVPANATVVKGPGQHAAKDMTITGVRTFHDASGGSERGTNDMMCWDADGLRVCHAGDLGHALTPEQLKALGTVDVLLLPVGGTFTVDAKGATEVVEQIKPKVVIPMHYKTAKIGLPIAGLEDFVKGKGNVVEVGGSEVTLKRESLPRETQVMVLEPALL